MIVVVDYGTANLKSVANAIDLLGHEVKISKKVQDLEQAERIVLPGVGTFAEGMKNLIDLKLKDALVSEIIQKKKPFLGICLGLHLLATTGYEGGITPGLNFIPGEVKQFDLKGLRIPHMGWDQVSFRKQIPLWDEVKDNTDLYFVHKYHFIPKNAEDIAAVCDYGGEFVTAVQKDNIFATQFHPEKSQEDGLKILENFCRWNPC
ncbi:MAG TPA: imidazole glycerol phosphate synthase subunit HisH [Candidatus Nanoarchaeia archaeon]|nr:imidazole glycerol phosphate synthase subunit HisH [Candidatus Nanoarchaeia archaeon]